MQRIKQRPVTSPGRRPWAAVALCLLFAFGAILHAAHATPAYAHASASEIMAPSDGSVPCDSGYAAGEHCQPPSGCPLCAPVGAMVTFLDRVPVRPPMAATALVPGGVVVPHFRPPRLPLRA